MWEQKWLKIVNADMSGPYYEKLDWATANQGAQFLRIADRNFLCEYR